MRPFKNTVAFTVWTTDPLETSRLDEPSLGRGIVRKHLYQLLNGKLVSVYLLLVHRPFLATAISQIYFDQHG